MNGLARALGRAALPAALSISQLIALSTGRPVAAAEPCDVPQAWRLDEIAAASPPYGSEGKVYLLAWQALEDERPFRVEEALVLKQVVGAGGSGADEYHLAHLYRHPEEKRPTWNLAQTHVSPEPGVREPGRMLFHFRSFPQRPTNLEIDAAMAPDQVRWSFALEAGWRRTASRVCERNWRAAIGGVRATRLP